MNIKKRFSTSILRLIVPLAIYLLCGNVAVAQNLADFALGGRNICAIDVDGNLECTTRFATGTHLPPADGTLYKAVSSGVNHSCAITQSGDMRCWGINNFGQLDAPSVAVGFVSLSASGNHTCAVDANMQAHCWGLNTNGQTNVPEPNNGFLAVHTGEGSSCGTKESGALVCWTTDTNITGGIPNAPGYTDIALSDGGGRGGIQSCGLTPDGSIDCWSSNQLAPEVPSNGPYTQIAKDVSWLCGLTLEGVLDCNFRALSSTNINERNQGLFDEIGSLPPLSKFDLLTQSSTITSLCGLTLNGELVCVGDSLPANSLPGTQDMALENIFALESLDFAVYSDTTVELFWVINNRSPDGNFSIIVDTAGANIYRDNELLAVTSNGSSFIDDTLVAGQEYVYTVALVDDAGFEGPLSTPILVSTGDRGKIDSQDNIDNSLSHPDQPTNISITRYGDSSLEIFWDKPTSFANVRYQIYRNGEFLAFTPGPSYFDQNVNSTTAYFYTIVVERSGEDVIGVGFVNEPARN